jgi:hypothetical protein
MRNIFFLISVLTVTLSCAKDNSALPGNNGKLSGVVAIKNVYGQAIRADAGSAVYAIRQADADSTQYRDIAMVVDMFRMNKTYYQVSINKTADPARARQAKDNFDTLADYARKYISGFRELPAIVRASAGETGNYTLTLEPGKYFILVISGNLKSDNLLEKNGNIELRTVNIKPSAETRLDVTFEKQELLWIRLVTGWKQEGC